ncbi:hypothetical protein J3458_002314 [Metarhizium acridum]|uniref:uncharacterized protein n=1 Tax=Metarhizium acridum TaxID=92637 RepID=UPI001C6BEDA5|nr:hypothetical protein J3458_002314 [Metarhizium acridum]
MSGSKPRHTFDRFLEEEELADRMLKVAGSTQTTPTAKVAKDTPPHQAAAKDGKGNTDGDWEVVEAPGASGGKAAAESWVDVGSTTKLENQERGTASVQQTKKT